MNGILQEFVACSLDSIKIFSEALVNFLAQIFINKESLVDFDELFKFLKIETPKYYDCKNQKEKITYILKTDFRFDFEQLEKNQEIIARFFQTEKENIELEKVNNYLYITKYKDIELNYAYKPQKGVKDGFKVIIGYNNHKERYFDISEPSNSHIFIGASTRGGKSNLIRLILTQLIQKPRYDIELSIINPKVVDFEEFEKVKNVVHYTEDVSEKEPLKILAENIELMNKRYQLFKRTKVKNIIDYRKKVDKIPFRIIVIDELATYQDYQTFGDALRELANKGAGAGIILMLSSQILSKDVMPNQVRQNLNTVFGGRCKDSTKSNMIMENADLHKIKKVGQFKIFDIDSKQGGDLVQTLKIDDETVKSICEMNVKKPLRGGTLKDLR